MAAKAIGSMIRVAHPSHFNRLQEGSVQKPGSI